MNDDLALFDQVMETWARVMRACIEAHEPVDEIWACAERCMGIEIKREEN